MYQFFLICATIGATILVLRLGLSILGLGVDHLDGMDVDVHMGDVGHGHVGDAHDHDSHLGRLLTFQGIVAFLAFFGVGGLWALSLKLHPALALAMGLGTGLAAMVLLGFALGALSRLNTDGTVRIEQSVGLTATVYLRIPGEGAGDGKITLPIQGRTVEVKARTPGPMLRQGDAVVVSRVLDDQTVEVVVPVEKLEKPAAIADLL